MPVQIEGNRLVDGHRNVALHIRQQRQRIACLGGIEGGGEVSVVVGRAARLRGGDHAGFQVGVAVVAEFVAVCVNVAGAADDLDFLDRIVIFQFPCIFQKRPVLPEGIALCQQIAQFDRLAAFIRDLIVSTAVETRSISGLHSITIGKRKRIDLPCAGRTDKPAVRAGYRYIADVAVIACPLAQIQCTVLNDKGKRLADKTAAARNDQ